MELLGSHIDDLLSFAGCITQSFVRADVLVEGDVGLEPKLVFISRQLGEDILEGGLLGGKLRDRVMDGS